jgi:hypothetical protein
MFSLKESGEEIEQEDEECEFSNDDAIDSTPGAQKRWDIGLSRRVLRFVRICWVHLI